MQFDNFTIQSQEVIQAAQGLAQVNDHQSIENGHLLKALIKTDESILTFIVKKQGISLSGIEMALDRIIEAYPKVSGGQLYISQEANKTLVTGEGGENIILEFSQLYF